MTFPAALWYLVSRTVVLLVKWVSVVVVIGVTGALLGSWFFLACVLFAGFRVWRSRPIPDPVVVDFSEDRYRDHLDRVLRSLDVTGESPTPRSGEGAHGSPVELDRPGPVYIRDLGA